MGKVTVVPGVGAMKLGGLGDSLEAEGLVALPILGGGSVHLSLDASPDGTPAKGALEALAAFLALGEEARPGLTDAVWDDYHGMLSAYMPGEVPCEIGAHERERVWEHLRPRHCSVGGARGGTPASVTVHCDTDWDPEHGITLAFEDGTELVRDRWTRSGEDD